MLNIKSYLRFLSRNKLYTFINVFGLSLSLMFVILIANFTVGELTTDSFQKNADQIYVLGSEEFAETAYRIGDRLKSRYPEIEKTCGVITQHLPSVLVEALNIKSTGSFIAVDTTFFDVFSFELKQGNRDHALASKNSVVISERFAKKMFGALNPVGQRIIISNSFSYIVSAVVEDFENTMFNYTDMIIPVENMVHFNKYAIAENLGNARGTVLFLQIVEGADITLKTEDMLEYLKTFFWVYERDIAKHVTLTPMRELYSNELKVSRFKKRDNLFLSALLIVGFFILVFAILNYINLTVAQTGFRAKEVSMRRLLGSSKQMVFLKMIFESILLCGVAFLIGLIFAIAIEPYASDLIGTKISVLDNISVMWVVTYVLLVVVLGGVSGVFPTIVISRFKPIDVVRGSFSFKSKMTYSKLFITVQAMITIILIACSITVVKQVEHMLNANLGYNQKGIIHVNVFGGSFRNQNQIEQFRHQLKSLPAVKSVGFTMGTPLSFNFDNMTKVEGVNDMLAFQKITSDSATVNMLGIRILRDNQISGDGVWLNETAMRTIGADVNTKSFKTDWEECVIKGVVNDFVLGDVMGKGSNSSSALLLTIKEDIEPWSILVEVNGDLFNSFREVEKVFKELTHGKVFEAEFLDQQVAKRFKNQKKTSTIMMVFTFIAIIISSLGLLAMSTYFIQQRSLEIAMCKVFGSTTSQVLEKLVWQFLRLVVVAFLIACPIIWYTMSEWLKEFPYRIDLSVWIFIGAGGFTLLISFITVFWQSSIAANTSPVKCMKR